MQATYTLSELPNVVKQLYNEFKGVPVWAFDASMGSGKTTLIYQLCKFLQVEDEVSSPTFSIINQYKSPISNHIYHMDWYRLKSEDEAIQAGVEDILYNRHLCLIEWPSIAEGLLPTPFVLINITIIDQHTRQLTAILQ